MGYTLAKDFQPPEPQPAYDERGVYRPAWGGIGNLVALYKDGVEAAVYEYSPYGDGARERGDGRSASRTARRAEEAGAPWAATKQLLRSRGPYADHNPLRYGSGGRLPTVGPLYDLPGFTVRGDSHALSRLYARPAQEFRQRKAMDMNRIIGPLLACLSLYLIFLLLLSRAKRKETPYRSISNGIARQALRLSVFFIPFFIIGVLAPLGFLGTFAVLIGAMVVLTGFPIDFFGTFLKWVASEGD